MQAEIIDKIFETLSRNNSNPKTELKYVNDFTLLVAVVLSAQATDSSVNKATETLFNIYNTPEKMLELGETGLKNYIKSIGLFTTKARNIMELSRNLIEQHNSKVPNEFTELIKLPGVGRKTANVVLNCLFNKPTIGVDTHVFRVAKRLGLAHRNTPAQIELELLNNIDVKWHQNVHHWLILLGRYICKARVPNCPICPVKNYCDYFKKLNQ